MKVIVLGPVGSGKSCLINNMAKKWSEDLESTGIQTPEFKTVASAGVETHTMYFMEEASEKRTFVWFYKIVLYCFR